VATQAIERLGYQPLQQLAYDKIRQGILSGSYGPGEQLSIRGLAARYGVSSIPVREAMRRLEAEGLVHFSPNKGVRVNELSREDLEEVFLIRLELETLALKSALRKITRADLDELESLLEELQSSAKNASKWFEVHQRFHFRVYAAAGLPRLQHMIMGLWSVMAPYFGVFVRSTRDLANVHAEHLSLLRSLRAKDVRTATRLLAAHMASTHTIVLEGLRGASLRTAQGDVVNPSVGRRRV
jgi:DNA-binding GntR family transcriptional regulator